MEGAVQLALRDPQELGDVLQEVANDGKWASHIIQRIRGLVKNCAATIQLQQVCSASS